MDIHVCMYGETHSQSGCVFDQACFNVLQLCCSVVQWVQRVERGYSFAGYCLYWQCLLDMFNIGVCAYLFVFVRVCV